MAIKILDGEILAGDTEEVDPDLKKGEMKFERDKPNERQPSPVEKGWRA